MRRQYLEQKLSDHEFMRSLVGLSATERANCYESLISQISTICVLGELIAETLRDPGSAMGSTLENYRSLLWRMLFPMRNVVLMSPFPVTSKNDFPAESTDIQGVYAFVDKRLASMFAGQTATKTIPDHAAARLTDSFLRAPRA